MEQGVWQEIEQLYQKFRVSGFPRLASFLLSV